MSARFEHRGLPSPDTPLHSSVAALKQTRASLQTELQTLSSLPDAPSNNEERASHPLARELMDAEERLVLTRMAGWTLFLADMAPGRRAKSVEGAHVGLGVRMEGFCRGECAPLARRRAQLTSSARRRTLP